MRHNPQDSDSPDAAPGTPAGSKSPSLIYFPRLDDRHAPVSKLDSVSQESGRAAVLHARGAGLDPRRSGLAISSLVQITRALTSMTEGVDSLLETIARTIAEVFDSSFVFVDAKAGYKHRRAMYLASGQEESADRVELLEHQPCLNENVLAEQGVVEVDRLSPGRLPCSRLGNVVCLPMPFDGTPEGCICIQSEIPGGPNKDRLALLRVFANQAAVAIGNARMFEESAYLRAQAEDLYRIAVRQKNEAERKQLELQEAMDEIDSMEREQIISSERERIARELHDDVAQILISIGLNLEWCRQHLPAGSDLEERLALLKQMARNGLYEIRNAILGLSSANISEVGLTCALGKLTADFEKISRVHAEFQAEGVSRLLPQGVGNALYYIAQEALYNVFKHARAQSVEIRLLYESEALCLSVTDDGVGIDQGETGLTNGSMTFGIKNMLRRAEELGGSLMIGKGETSGTRIVARIPG